MTEASDGRRQLAVLGSPISHSQSPVLHRAAYAVLGLPWSYEPREVRDRELSSFLGGLDESWQGLSLTMPLKREVLPLLDTRSSLVDVVGGANTVLLVDGVHGFNTDVGGIVAAFREAGVETLRDVHILGAGATAASMLAAVSQLGATRAVVSARDPEKVASLRAVADAVGLELEARALGVAVAVGQAPSAVVSTLPGGAADALPEFALAVRRESVLFDVAYAPWPSALARSWHEAHGTVIQGLSMLLYQAIAQVRIFVTGREDGQLPREAEVAAAMRSAVGLVN
ncbi:MAG TPA: shikimate dehydrogenase [Pseudolysinimonas sp.]|nr:shikimate dehydrogenase [Pseudolysinimonas sp.]